MKVQILTDDDHLFLLTTFLYWLHLDSKYKLSVKISTFIETIYLKGLLIRNVLVSSQFMSMYNCSLKMKQETTNLLDV
jgi:hypothetical protein